MVTGPPARRHGCQHHFAVAPAARGHRTVPVDDIADAPLMYRPEGDRVVIFPSKGDEKSAGGRVIPVIALDRR